MTETRVETPTATGASGAGPFGELVERMWSVWNERDVENVRAGIDAVFSPDVEFIDPHYAIAGRPAFEAMVRTFRGRFPEAICSLSSGIDAHHGLLRYHWEIHLGEQFLIEGFDVTELDASGQIKRVLGFFGPIPSGPVPSGPIPSGPDTGRSPRA